MKKQNVHIATLASLNDMLTPVAAYRRLRDHFPGALLLESADYHDRSDSKSFICLNPIAGFEANDLDYQIDMPDAETEKRTATIMAEVLDAFQSFFNCFHVVTTSEEVDVVGLFGYTSFESVEYFEQIELKKPTSSSGKNIPNMKYQLFEFVLIFDHFKNQLTIVAHGVASDGSEHTEVELPKVNRIRNLLRASHSPTFYFQTKGDEKASISDQSYLHFVEQGIRHCLRGDVFQLVLSRAFSQAYRGDDFQVYRALRHINPSPYLFYFDYGQYKIFGSSPEAQLQVESNRASIHPIAGTARRTGDRQDDIRKGELLRNNPKEMSEHVMLVDLARNDLSRHTEDVQVASYAEIQYFSHVIHLVSRVEGEIKKGHSPLDLFAHTFPAGTLTGAPKYRAMELIDAIEPENRGYYGGAIGFFGFDGSVNHAILIRSFLSVDNHLHYQAGAGIVADSTPEGELEEVNNKISALRKAIVQATEI